MAYHISSLSEKDEKKLESLWNRCSKSDYLVNDDISTTVELYHATTIENRESILACGEFWVPSRKYAIENGLKLGAAVYFGTNLAYCLREAKNKEENKGKQLVLVKVLASLGRCLDLGRYDAGNNLSFRDWEWMTERISIVESERFGFDSLCINKNMPWFEIAIYNPTKQIKRISSFDKMSTQRCHIF